MLPDGVSVPSPHMRSPQELTILKMYGSAKLSGSRDSIGCRNLSTACLRGPTSRQILTVRTEP